MGVAHPTYIIVSAKNINHAVTRHSHSRNHSPTPCGRSCSLRELSPNILGWVKTVKVVEVTHCANSITSGIYRHSAVRAWNSGANQKRLIMKFSSQLTTITPAAEEIKSAIRSRGKREILPNGKRGVSSQFQLQPDLGRWI